MKTRLLAILMVCALCLTLLPGFALADEAPAASAPAEEPAEPASEPEAPAEDPVEETEDPAADGGILDELQDLIELLRGGGDIGESAENGLRVYDAETGENPCYLRVPINETATLQAAVEADDETDLVCRWYERTSLLGALQIPKDLRREGPDLTTEPVTKDRNYICMVTDRFGNKVALNYYLTPDTGLKAWAVGDDDEQSSWLELAVPKGETPVLEVMAEGLEPLTYEWHAYEQVQQEDSPEWNRLDDILSTGESLTASPVTGAARYVCTVTDSYGYEAYVTFDLVVDNGFEAYAAKEPFTAKPGEEVELQVIARALEGPITYQWIEMSRDEEDPNAWIPGDPIPGAEEDTLTVTVTGSARYLCQVSDPYSSAEVFVIVEPDTGLTARVRGTEEDWAVLHAAMGETVTLAVDARVDEGGLTYQWMHSEPVEDWREYAPVDGADGPELTTVPIEDLEEYLCVVTDDYGSFREVTFRIYPDDGFTLEPDSGYDYTVKTEAVDEDDPTEYDVCYVYTEPGGTVTLAYKAVSRSGGLQAEWGSDLWDWEREEREPNEPLVLENVMDDGLYLAAVYNRFQEEKDLYFRVVVNWDPLDKNHDTQVDVRDAAAFLADPDTDGFYGAVLVLRRVLGLDA